MLVYQIKFGFCLLLFYLFYKFLLERQSFHHFKRFYLLLTYVLAALIPVLTLPFTSSLGTVDLYTTHFITTAEIADVSALSREAKATMSPVLLIYFLVLAVLLLRFTINLRKLLVLAKCSPKMKSAEVVFVLMKEQVQPHTFWNYIFVNKDQYLKKKIPDIILKHEEAHAIQKHSLDILIVELICALFWFNPLVYLLKRPIKLNHEFLADREVLKTGIARITYWDALLNGITSRFEPYLVHSFNYSSIKKRLLIMKKETGRRSAIARQIGVMILISIAFYSFSKPADESDSILPLKQISKSMDKTGDIAQEYLMENARPSHNDRGPTPSEFILEMKDQDAAFFYNDHSITPDEAVLLIKHALRIDLVTMHTGLDKPVVKLSNAEMPAAYQEIILLYHQ